MATAAGSGISSRVAPPSALIAIRPPPRSSAQVGSWPLALNDDAAPAVDWAVATSTSDNAVTSPETAAMATWRRQHTVSTWLLDLRCLRRLAVDDGTLQPQRRRWLDVAHLEAHHMPAVGQFVLPEGDEAPPREVGGQFDRVGEHVIDEHVDGQHAILAVLAADVALNREADAVEAESRLVALGGACEPHLGNGMVAGEVLLQ